MNWLLEQGPPRWLDDPRSHIRALRLSLALGILGFISASLSACVMYLFFTIDPLMKFLAPGLCFGFVALIPLSRWLGRGWFLTLLAVPVSVVASFWGAMAWPESAGMFLRSDTPLQRLTCGFVGGFVGALIVGIWMGNPRQWQSWRAVLCATVLAALGCGCGLPFYDAKKFTGSDFAVMLRAQMSFALGVDFQRYRELIFIGMIAPVLYAFQCVVPVCLGIRLWSPVSMREAGPS